MFDSGININTIREKVGHNDERTSVNKTLEKQKLKNLVNQDLRAHFIVAGGGFEPSTPRV